MEVDADLAKLQDEYERVKEKAEAAKAKAKAKLDRAKARKSAAVRKYDAKRKIVAGGFLFKLAADGDENALSVLRLLYKHLRSETARDSDKRAFEEWEWPGTRNADERKASAPSRDGDA